MALSYKPIVLSQVDETPVIYNEAGPFYYRYAYARSAESRDNEDSGQDYLALAKTQNRFVFCLCDGVSQSFFGDLAARMLGENLLAYFMQANFRVGVGINSETLSQVLSELTGEASRMVAAYPIPNGLPALLLGALEKKRAIGSESTFIVGGIDLDQDAACFAWMGDSRLRLWKGNQEITDLLGDRFCTKERWSSAKGLVGTLHGYTMVASELSHIMAYSDGFSGLDPQQFIRASSHHAINRLMDNDLAKPSSDDISFIEIWWNERPKIPNCINVGRKQVAKSRQLLQKITHQWKAGR